MPKAPAFRFEAAQTTGGREAKEESLMKLVLLSGGSGKRLWPLSNDSRSKQFLKVLRGPGGNLESMVQRVWRQMEEAGFSKDACIATGRSQSDMLRSQIGSGVTLVTEPERRDTYPAIALAASYLYSVAGAALNETVVVLPVDPYVEQSFYAKIRELDAIIQDTGAELALIGVKPTFPSEKYGYIVPEPDVHHAGSGAPSANTQNAGADASTANTHHAGADASATYSSVSRFVEKPAEAEARALLAQNALWNCGVFAFKLNYLIDRLIEARLPLHYDEMVRQYAKMPKISFDYEVVEKAGHIVCTSYDGGWKDLGTWNTLTEEMDTPLLGNGRISEDSSSCHLINELDIPVTVLGMNNVIVAASPDGILVTERDASPRIKEMLKNMDQPPMYEELRWGWFRVLDSRTFPDGREVLTRRVGIGAGKHLNYQKYYNRSQVWTVVYGSGEFVLEGFSRKVAAGDVLYIPNGMKYCLRAETELELIEVHTGHDLAKEVAQPVFTEWEEIKKEVMTYDQD
jgi:mannose-1-phosphate guanylyltransferase